MATLNSIVKLKCPQCGKGDMFEKPGLFQFKNILDMPENCSKCGQKFEIEPGFWIGALWTSYPIIIILVVPFLIYAVRAEHSNMLLVMLSLMFVLTLCYPLILRLGRSIWIHIFISKNK